MPESSRGGTSGRRAMTRTRAARSESRPHESEERKLAHHIRLYAMSQLTRCPTSGWRGGRVPLRTPRTEIRRDAAPVDPPSMRPPPGRSPGQDDERRAVPGVRERTVGRGRQPAAQVLHFVTAFQVTAATDRAGSLLRSSRNGWPTFSRNQAAPLRCRGHRRPTPTRRRARAGHSEREHRRREPGSQIIGKTSRTTGGGTGKTDVEQRIEKRRPPGEAVVGTGGRSHPDAPLPEVRHPSVPRAIRAPRRRRPGGSKPGIGFVDGQLAHV